MLDPSIIFSLALGLSALVSSISFAEPEDSVIRIESLNSMGETVGSGTGFVAETKSGKKVVISNEHVCKGSQSMFSYYEGKTYRHKVIAISNSADLCMLTAPKHLKPLKVSKKLKRNEDIRAIGFPLSKYKITTKGKYKGPIDMSMPENIPPNLCKGKTYYKLIATAIPGPGGIPYPTQICVADFKNLQFTTVISAPGGSGSPLLNDDDEVVGVISMTQSHLAGPSWAIGVNLRELRLFLGSK